MKHTVAFSVFLVLILIGCGIPQQSPVDSQATTPATEVVAAGRALRGVRYCEILVVSGPLTALQGSVYNTVGLNDCPEEQWKAVDAEAIKKQFKAVAVLMNGPRYFLMDDNTLKNPGAVTALSGLGVRLLAVIKLSPDSLIGGGSTKPYNESQVDRDTEYVFEKGRTVYELVSPEGRVYVETVQ